MAILGAIAAALVALAICLFVARRYRRQLAVALLALFSLTATAQDRSELSAELQQKLDNEKNPKALIILVPAADGKREEKTFKVGDTVPAIIDYNEFDDGLIKLKKNLEEMESEARKKYNKELVIIQKAAGEYWREDWRWNMRVVTASGVRDGGRY